MSLAFAPIAASAGPRLSVVETRSYFSHFEPAAKKSRTEEDSDWDMTLLHTYPLFTEARLQKLLSFLSAFATRTISESDLFLFTLTWRATAERSVERTEMTDMLRFSFNREIGPIVFSPESKKAKALLDRNLNNRTTDADMPLADRGDFISAIGSFVDDALNTKLAKTMLLRLQSTRGSGKTQLLKHCLYVSATKAICSGRVMVVECGLPISFFSSSFDALHTQALEGPLQEEHLSAFVVSLIRSHMRQCLPHAELSNDVVTVDDAYRAWEVAAGGSVLIAMDTVDRLPQQTGIASLSDPSKYRGFVESIAFALPSRGSLIAVGTRRIDIVDVNSSPCSDVLLRSLPAPRLFAFTYDGYISALERSWGVFFSRSSKSPMTSVLHYLCGGVPRLLSLVSQGEMKPPANDSFNEWWVRKLVSCVMHASRFMQHEMPCDGEAHYLLWAVGALASGTKTPVDLDAPMPLLGGGATWGDATKGLLYMTAHARGERQVVATATADKGLAANAPEGEGPTADDMAKTAFALEPTKTSMAVLKLPPILMLNDSAQSAFVSLREGREDFRVPSSRRTTWPRGLDAAFLHLAASSTAELSALTFSDDNGVDDNRQQREVLYKKLVANAIVARWYLLWLTGGGAPNSRRIPLNTLLCSDDPLLEGISVDFSGGLVADSNHLPLRPTDSGYDADRHGFVLQLCGDDSESHSIRFAAKRSIGTNGGHLQPKESRGEDGGGDAKAVSAEKHIIVSCVLQSGEPKSAAQLQQQCFIIGDGSGQRGEVDLLLAISPCGPSMNHHAAGDVLEGRCVHISSHLFCNTESVFMCDPKHIARA